MEKSEKSYKSLWLYQALRLILVTIPAVLINAVGQVLRFILVMIPVVLILATGWFLGGFVESIFSGVF